MSDKPPLSDIRARRQARRIRREIEGQSAAATCRRTRSAITIPRMLQSDSCDSFGLESEAMARPLRVARRRPIGAPPPQSLPETQPFPRWARFTAAGGAGNAMFFAGAGIAHLDQLLRAGEGGVEPVFSGALRQRLALKAAATCARLARLREDDAALRDAEHLSGVGAETSPAGRVHRLWRLFATRPVRLDAATLSLAIEHLEAQDVVDVRELADALRDVMASVGDPLAAAMHVSEAATSYLALLPRIDAELFALWLADVALAQRIAWRSPIPLLATVIAHPALRLGQQGQRPRAGDRDWSNVFAAAYAIAAREAVDLAAALSRQTQKLFDVAPTLRAKGAARVIEMLLDDDCICASCASSRAKLSDRAARRLFDRLTELGAVRELSGRTSFRLYGL